MMHSNDNKRSVPTHLKALMLSDNMPVIKGVDSVSVVMWKPYGYYGQL